MSKKLVIYYSLTGKTELVAKAIAKTTNADLKKIGATRQEIDNYDLIFVGSPVWALNPTPAISTFISKTNFANKKVVLFVTMGRIGGRNAIRVMSNKIKSKGGEIIGTFAIRTLGVGDNKIVEKGIEIGKKYIR
jgi:flavodoxin